MRPSVCLNMIVKNEAHVIARCLRSVRPLIDRWVIVDTGSTDGTQDVIREVMADVPGDLVERPWKDFAHNRSEAIALAGTTSDYLFFIDADDELVVDDGTTRAPLTEDLYSVLIEHGDTRHWRPSLVATRVPWHFCGVLHEYLETNAPSYTSGRLEGARIRINSDGARSSVSDVEKYSADARVLEKALKDDPKNTRYMFYLAQSYRDSGRAKKALDAYARRAAAGGWEEEVWHSLYQIAVLTEQLSMPWAVVVQRYLEAYQAMPARAEPLVQLARYCREKRQFALAQMFAARAAKIPLPNATLFVEASAYSWAAKDELAVASYWVGDYAACAELCRSLLDNPALPVHHVPRIAENLRFAEEHMKKS